MFTACLTKNVKNDAILNVGAIIGLDILSTRDPIIAGRKPKK